MYGKIFEDIFYSSLMFQAGWKAVYIFSTLIVLADQNGIVNIDPRSLYRSTGMEADSNITYEEFKSYITELEKPDPDSNIQDFEGRRIIPLSEIDHIEQNRGWLIVNAMHYRDKRCKEDRKDYMKNYMSDRRKHEKLTNVNSKQKELTNVNSKQLLTVLANTDTDTDTDTKIKRVGQNKKHFDQFWFEYPKKVKGKRTKEIWISKKLDAKADIILADIKNRLANDARWLGGYIPDPTTYLTGERWNDEIEKSKPKEKSRITDWLKWGKDNDIPAKVGESNDQYIRRLQSRAR